MAALYWFTQDLRISDNKILEDFLASDAPRYACYFVNPNWITTSESTMGKARWLFLKQSLCQLKASLSEYGVPLLIVIGNPTELLPALAKKLKISSLCFSNPVGFNESKQISAIRKALHNIMFKDHWSHTLFDQTLIQDIGGVNKSFSAFKKTLEASAVIEKLDNSAIENTQCLNDKTWLNESDITISYIDSLYETSQPLSIRANNQEIIGGCQSGLKHLKEYFASGAISHYKQTRNDLHGYRRTSLFSPWLANGSLSPRQVWQGIVRYEKEYEQNDSTYWLKCELLWREYFQWSAVEQGVQLFTFKGLSKSAPKTSFYPERYAKWCSGNTPYPLVNALMNQLNRTGFMSNRGRQIVASCFVNELHLDWRFGAKYFERHLIDYDVASNWGNWQYIAGVGKDPRGGRKFNLTKQAEFYDKDGEFTSSWGGYENTLPLDSFDIAGWPLETQ